MFKKIALKWNLVTYALVVAALCFLCENGAAQLAKKSNQKIAKSKSARRPQKRSASVRPKLTKKNPKPAHSRLIKRNVTSARPKSIQKTTPLPQQEPEKELQLHTTLPIKKIRVLLNEYGLNEEKTFTIKSASGFVLESPVKSDNCAIYQTQEMCLRYNAGRLHLRCKDGKFRRVKFNSLEVCNGPQKLTLNSKTYQGSLIFHVSNQHNKVFVINKLPLEDYVCSVVSCESTPSWPLSFQKIQAIISRTYALHQMQSNRNHKANQCVYDIKNTNYHQIYDGYHGLSKIRQAVNETAGLVVTYKNNIAFTEFDICCGGIQTNKMRALDRYKPYSCKAAACPYCHASPFHHWKIDLHANSFTQTLSKHPALANRLSFISTKNPLTDIKITDKDAAGIVYKIRLTSKNGRSATLAGTEVKRCFPDKIRSWQYSIKKIKDRIVINGNGYGHQRGICQWGCKELVDRNWPIKKILTFYYPGTQLKRLVA